MMMMRMRMTEITVQYGDAAVFKKFPEDVNVDYDVDDEHSDTKSLQTRNSFGNVV